MKTGCILMECAAIVAVAGVLGTAVHLNRNEKLKISFIGQYEDPYGIRKKAPPPQPRPKNPAPDEPASDAKKIVVEARQKAAAAKEQPQPIPVPTSIAKDSPVLIPTDPTGAAVPVKETAEAPQASGKAVAKSGVPEITVDEAFEQFKNDAVFLDARRTRFYEQSHIPRARAMSVWEADLDKRISDLLNEVPLDIAMVIYCTGGDCEDSHMLAGKLKQAGFTSLMIFVEGFPKWVEKSHPVEKGAADGQAGEEGR